jgi:hypothetical protein
MTSRKGWTWISIWVVAVMTIATAIAAPDKPARKVTGAQLMQDLAAAVNPADSRRASAILRDKMIGVRSDAPITEAGAVALLRSLGVDVTTSAPDRALSRQQADALVAKFKGHLTSLTGAQGVAVGLKPVPASVDDCLVEKNHGACVDCCKALGGGAATCAKTCFVINKPSSSEPLP